MLIKTNPTVKIRAIKAGLFKISLFFSFLFFALKSSANNYYFSSSSGSDTYTASQAQNPSTPWKSISKLNSVMATLVYGDAILFKSGETFYGTIKPSVSGLTFGAYGSGDKPVITGLTTVTGWSSVGTNLWEAGVPGGLATLNMVVIDGVPTPMGRYPNVDAPNGGYLTYESAVQNLSLTDNQLTASPNWTGGEVLFRRKDYTADRAKITSHTGNTLQYSTYAGDEMTPGYGYFIENHPSTLDQNGEWYYNPGTKKIRMYYAGTPPYVQAATVANIVNLVYTGRTVKSKLSFKGLSFRGAEDVIMKLAYCNDIMIDDCDFSDGGVNAIEYDAYVTYLTVQNSDIFDINMIGINETSNYQSSNVSIRNNNLKRIGINAGMISNAYGQGASSTGIHLGCGNLVIQENRLDSIGYNAIALRINKDNQTIRKNVISNFCSVKNDGGGIYNTGQRGAPGAANIYIDSNIIYKSVGALAGSTSLYNKHARGIYLDATSIGLKILNNTIFDCWEGIYISESQNNIIRGNTIYNTGSYNPELNYFSGALLISEGYDGFVHNINNTITNNVFFAKTADQLLHFQVDRYNRIPDIGLVDSNYYVNPWADAPVFLTNTTTASIMTGYSMDMWKSIFTTTNQNSKGTPKSLPQFTYSAIGSNKAPNEAFTTNITGVPASSSPTTYSISWDNTGQITGGGSAKLTNLVTSNNFSNFYELIGAIDASKKYVLRFKTKGTKLGTFKTYLQQWSGAYPIITSKQMGSVNLGIQQHEISFEGEHSTQSKAALFIQFSQNSGTVFIDDVQFFEASVTPTKVDDYIRFEYNPSNSPLTVPLPFNYIGANGVKYRNGSITIAPYSSKVLIKDTGTVTGNPIPLRASSTAGTIAVTGGTTTLTVTATGGLPPYVGTGTFTVKAGTYRNTVKDSKGDSSVTTITITEPSRIAPLVASSSAGNITVPGGTTTLTITATGGVAPYSGTGTFIVKSGHYNISVRDSRGTVTVTSITIDEPTYDPLVASSSAGTITVAGGTTTVRVSATGGVPPYDGPGNFIVKAGHYNILVKDAVGNSSVTSITITEPNAPPLTASSTAGRITVRGGTTTVTVSATGGVPPYDGVGNFIVKAGQYNILVKDSKGNSTVTRITITEPAARSNSTASRNNADANTIGSQGVGNTELKSLVSPNPSSSEFALQLSGGSSENVNVVVLSADGRAVYKASGSSSKLYRFGRSFGPGIYIIQN